MNAKSSGEPARLGPKRTPRHEAGPRDAQRQPLHIGSSSSSSSVRTFPKDAANVRLYHCAALLVEHTLSSRIKLVHLRAQCGLVIQAHHTALFPPPSSDLQSIPATGRPPPLCQSLSQLPLLTLSSAAPPTLSTLSVILSVGDCGPFDPRRPRHPRSPAA